MINAITPGYIARRRLVPAYTTISINVVELSSLKFTPQDEKIVWVSVNILFVNCNFMVVKGVSNPSTSFHLYCRILQNEWSQLHSLNQFFNNDYCCYLLNPGTQQKKKETLKTCKVKQLTSSDVRFRLMTSLWYFPFLALAVTWRRISIVINPLIPNSDQHQVSPPNING